MYVTGVHVFRNGRPLTYSSGRNRVHGTGTTDPTALPENTIFIRTVFYFSIVLIRILSRSVGAQKGPHDFARFAARLNSTAERYGGRN